MRQGKASRDSGVKGMSPTGVYNPGGGPSYGAKIEPKSYGTSPGYAGQLGQMQGSHVTSHDDTNYRGEKMHIDRGFKAPPVKSQSSNRGSQGRY